MRSTTQAHHIVRGFRSTLCFGGGGDAVPSRAPNVASQPPTSAATQGIWSPDTPSTSSRVTQIANVERSVRGLFTRPAADSKHDKKDGKQDDKKDNDNKKEPEPRATERTAPQDQELIGKILLVDAKTTTHLLGQAAAWLTTCKCPHYQHLYEEGVRYRELQKRFIEAGEVSGNCFWAGRLAALLAHDGDTMLSPSGIPS